MKKIIAKIVILVYATVFALVPFGAKPDGIILITCSIGNVIFCYYGAYLMIRCIGKI